MASSKPPSFSTALPEFQRLNPKTYLYDPAAAASPATTAAQTTTTPPSLILLCSWMDARPQHIAKYTAAYRALYPTTPILLLASATSDFFFNPPSRQARELSPALAVIREHCPDDKGDGGLLVHALSNGGCGHLAMLATLHTSTTSTPLPARAVVYDSAPGQSRFVQGFAAMSAGLARTPLPLRWVLQAALAVLLVVFFHLPPLFGRRTLAGEMRAVLNDGGKLRAGAPRTYVYSAEDVVILAEDVEEHAVEAEAAGLVVRREVFEGTAHVGHVRGAPERYWGVVGEAWERRG